MAIKPTIPSVNQILNLAIALLIMFLILRFLPENIKQYFRV
ncbi:MAG: hypothetical protein WAV28_07015 [Sedimentisphaerales bacterium]